MFTTGNIQLDADALAFRRRALRDAVLCLGWLKIFSLTCYVCLYYLVVLYSRGNTSMVIQILCLAILGPYILLAILLIMGALYENTKCLAAALVLSLFVASYNSFLGGFGAIFFMQKGYITIHFLIACLFAVLAFSFLTILCHDIIIIFTYRNIIVNSSPQSSLPPPVPNTIPEPVHNNKT